MSIICENTLANSFLIIGNGQFEEELIQNLITGRQIIVLDRAAKYLKNTIRPDYIIGDLDSIDEESLKCFRNHIIKEENQNLTDLEKAIRFCDDQQAREIIITSVLYKERLDHHLMAISCLKKYFKPDRRLRICSSSYYIEYFYNQDINFQTKKGQQIGIFGCPKGVVTSQGLTWELTNTLLSWGNFESCSNIAIDKEVYLKIKKGALVTRPMESEISRILYYPTRRARL